MSDARFLEKTAEMLAVLLTLPLDEAAEVLSKEVLAGITTAVETEREACAKIAETKVAHLLTLVTSVTLGGRAGKWQGGADAASEIAKQIRARSKSA